MATPDYYDFDEYEIQTITSKVIVPAGRHMVIDQGVMGASIRYAGRALNVPQDEWLRIRTAGKARKVPDRG